MKQALFVLIPLSLVLVADASAQSIFSTRGLGVPFAPVDARGQILGGTGVGLLGINTSMANPAEAVGARARGMVAAMQPTNRSVRFQGETDNIGGTRFPLIHMLQPVGQRLAFTVGYGAFLDQSWAASRDDFERVGGDSVLARTVFDQSGGISQVRVGVGYALLSNLAIGASGGFYTGHTDLTISRTFPEQEVPGLEPFEEESTVRYRAPQVTGGFSWDPIPIARLAATLTWSGDMEATNDDEEEVNYSVPLQVAAGASSWLTPQLLAAVSGRWAGWSRSDGEFASSEAIFDVRSSDSWDIGGGLEWTGGSIGARAFPIRLGGRYGRLPFHVEQEQTREWSLGMGFGAQLSPPESSRQAFADFTVERGGRGDADSMDLSESFWRFTFAVTVFGN